MNTPIILLSNHKEILTPFFMLLYLYRFQEENFVFLFILSLFQESIRVL